MVATVGAKSCWTYKGPCRRGNLEKRGRSGRDGKRKLNEHLSDQDRYDDVENRRCDCIGNCEDISSFFLRVNE